MSAEGDRVALLKELRTLRARLEPAEALADAFVAWRIVQSREGREETCSTVGDANGLIVRLRDARVAYEKAKALREPKVKERP